MLTEKPVKSKHIVNIRDVSRAAGFSVSTVSLVLSRHQRISPPTRAKVLRTVKALGYVPNVHARRLFTRRNRILGVVLAAHMRHAAAHAIYSQLFFGICAVIKTRGYQIMVASVDETRAAQPLPQMMTERQVDGVMLIGRGFRPEYVARITATGLPVFTCPERLPQCPAHAVVCDNATILALTVDYLVGLGHTAIAYLGAARKYWFSQVRYRAFRRAIARHQIAIPAAYVTACDAITADGGRDGAAKLLACDPPPTAIIAAGDLVAVGIIQRLQATGLRVPRDISVVGCDGLELGKYTNPPLTTVQIPWEQMGVEMTKALLKCIERPAGTGKEQPLLKTIPVSLVIRQSCLPPQKQRPEVRKESH